MATIALLDAFISINAVALSDHCRQVTVNAEVTDLDSTAFGDTWNEHTGGLKSGTVTLDFLDDFAASQVDATLWPLLGTVTAFVVRPNSGAVSATNPQYSGSLFIAQHAVLGSLNEMAAKSLTFPTSGTVTRAVA